MVIPDSIEPVVGWRCFDVVDGQLVSPQQRMPWPAGVKAQATCSRARAVFAWVQMLPDEHEQMRSEAIDKGHTPADDHYVKYLMPDGTVEKVDVHCPWGMQNFTAPITHYPDEGKEWVLVMTSNGHQSPHEQCHCGIHLAKNLELALDYGDHGQGCFGRVAGWGKSIIGSTGYRVEFAYPQELFFYKKPPANMGAYKVPMFPVLECREFVSESLGIDWHG